MSRRWCEVFFTEYQSLLRCITINLLQDFFSESPVVVCTFKVLNPLGSIPQNSLPCPPLTSHHWSGVTMGSCPPMTPSSWWRGWCRWRRSPNGHTLTPVLSIKESTLRCPNPGLLGSVEDSSTESFALQRSYRRYWCACDLRTVDNCGIQR